MRRISHEIIQENDFLPPFSNPFMIPPPPPLPISNFQKKLSPNILLVIALLAVIFFISGLIHLLIRFLLKPTVREPEDSDNPTPLHGQLQQLFHLHDAGLDQSFIDALPIFLYKAIIGLKDPFDCAVCLCEFEEDDKLRLLPKCSHAFHIDCIDTWLLSHSTCPLCRRSLLHNFSPVESCRPILLVLESESGASGREEAGGSNSLLGFAGEDDLRPPVPDSSVKKEEAVAVYGLSEEKVVPVKLGKFRNVDTEGGGEGGEGCSRGNFEQRRCFSMGSYEYVMDESCLVRVTIEPAMTKTKKKKKKKKKKKQQQLNAKRPGHKIAMSECDFHSTRDQGFKVFEDDDDDDDDDSKSLEHIGGHCSNGISDSATNLHKKESFSVSKIWLQSNKKEKMVPIDSSRRAFSFRLPLHRSMTREESKTKEKSGIEVDLEVGSLINTTSSRSLIDDDNPSFARRTLLWIVGN
ncbi:RING-H2 finger protein ATL13 [Apostasia shenzhenica]|uniref:RING-type E3 ubiquitin transferase n=1 Tax=Apostasia shenzhenica TaxID=1088818 RepID=A0A2I0A1K7_9ASPA|nr:RING-H2 finger protein ATL13 [Apostasia shenzhenica]